MKVHLSIERKPREIDSEGAALLHEAAQRLWGGIDPGGEKSSETYWKIMDYLKRRKIGQWAP